MPLLVCTGGTLRCTMGTTPATFTGGCARVDVQGRPAGTILDNVPMKNVAPFGLCMSLANPQVASATAAASGVLTPQPCVPVLPGPWAPGSASVDLEAKPALRDVDKLPCQWAGVISVVGAGQGQVDVR